MSCDESERGVIQLSSKSFNKFRREMAESFNAHQELRFLAAKTLYEAVGVKIKGRRRPIQWDDAFAEVTLDMERKYPSNAGRSWSSPSLLNGVDWMDIKSTILKTEAGELFLARPLKKDFKGGALTENRYDVIFGFIAFTPESRTVTWSVHENNHAVRDAWASPMGKAFTSALGRVEWTRGTGGKFFYTNEYQRENALDSEGGGGSTCSHRYGPLGKDDSPSRRKLKR